MCTVKPVLRDYCHERPLVLKDHIFLAEGLHFSVVEPVTKETALVFQVLLYDVVYVQEIEQIIGHVGAIVIQHTDPVSQVYMYVQLSVHAAQYI